MKLLSLVAGFLTAELASADRPADVANAYIPYDCYVNSEKAYGPNKGVIESDKDVVSGLDINAHKLVQISYCKDVVTETFTGITTTWAKWVDGERTDLKRLNMIGTLSALYDFDRNDALAAAGLETLTEEQLWGFDPYWFQEASPYQAQFYKERSTSHENQAIYQKWRIGMQNYFTEADKNADGELSRGESEEFFTNVREYDQKSGIVENWGQFWNTSESRGSKHDRYWNAVYLLGSPTITFTFQDWLRAEKIMETWYNAGLYEATGHAYGNYWQFDRFASDPYQGEYGATLSRNCGTVNLTEDDFVTAMRVSSGEFGVQRLDIQTNNNPSITLGGDSNQWYSHEDRNWIRFDVRQSTFAGFWAYTDETTNKINALGVLEADTACLNKFRVATGAAFGWASVLPGTQVPTPVVPEGIRLFEPDSVIEHEHDKVASDDLLIPTIIIYCLIFICMIVLVVMHMRAAKK